MAQRQIQLAGLSVPLIDQPTMARLGPLVICKLMPGAQFLQYTVYDVCCELTSERELAAIAIWIGRLECRGLELYHICGQI